MTGRMEALRAMLRDVELVLFDFDGPLCDVFAGYPAPRVARELETLAGETYATDDPLEVLRETARHRREAVDDVEDALIAAELRAISCSRSTTEGVEALRVCLRRGLRVGIVSNNSAEAVGAFLHAHLLFEDVSPLVGRAYRRPELMKPHTWPILKALALAECPASAAVFIGDSLSDIQVAQAVSMPCIAYSNKPGKRKLFESTGSLTIDNMAELAAAVDAARRRDEEA